MSSLPAPLSTTESPIFESDLQHSDHVQPNGSACQVIRNPNLTAVIAVSTKPEIVEVPPDDAEPLSEIMRRLELASANIHNFRLAARNARNLNGKLELLEKTISGNGVHLANVLKGSEMTVAEPLKPVKIRDRPTNFHHIGHLEEFTGQDILNLIVFYNNDFGIVLEDDEATRRQKLLIFLTEGIEIE